MVAATVDKDAEIKKLKGQLTRERGKRKEVARRLYTDQFRLHCLAIVDSRGGYESITSIANALGVPVSTLQSWYKGQSHPQLATLRERTKNDMAKACKEIAWLFIEALPFKLPSCNALQAATVVEKLGLMAQVLEGKPNSIQGQMPAFMAGIDLSKLSEHELNAIDTVCGIIAESQRRANDSGSRQIGEGTPASGAGEVFFARISQPDVAGSGARADTPTGMVS